MNFLWISGFGSFAFNLFDPIRFFWKQMNLIQNALPNQYFKPIYVSKFYWGLFHIQKMYFVYIWYYRLKWVQLVGIYNINIQWCHVLVRRTAFSYNHLYRRSMVKYSVASGQFDGTRDVVMPSDSPPHITGETLGDPEIYSIEVLLLVFVKHERKLV